MNLKTFESWFRHAKSLRRSSDEELAEFWRGYIMGLRRLHLGENFGTATEHARRLSIPPDEPKIIRRQYGHGYRAGFSGVGPYDLAGKTELKLVDDGNEGLQFVDGDGREYDTTEAFHVLRKERGLDWIASACGASVRTADGWCQGRTPRKQALMLLQAILEKEN